MSRICEICGKKPLAGHNVSHAKNRNKRRWIPNLKRVKLTKAGSTRYYKICTRCLRSMQKSTKTQ